MAIAPIIDVEQNGGWCILVFERGYLGNFTILYADPLHSFSAITLIVEQCNVNALFVEFLVSVLAVFLLDLELCDDTVCLFDFCGYLIQSFALKPGHGPSIEVQGLFLAF